MMPTLPLEAATERGVSPRSLEWSASRPWPMSRATSASFSWKTADMRTEPPFSLVPLSGAPASCSRHMSSKWPEKAAVCSGVSPCSACAVAFAPWRSSQSST